MYCDVSGFLVLLFVKLIDWLVGCLIYWLIRWFFSFIFLSPTGWHTPFTCQRWGLPHSLAQCTALWMGLV